ncbi:DUF1801 domain-containing protein [Corynebacterium lubricantis]|uniref:DUF1801 domain-containing protein n=1 Tax=Corynebacterium lubricantis TaxID=541095 RepID=UPI00036F5F31|nr:DUF1801 domain-containing protein [Corynebacterium lubricantis]
MSEETGFSQAERDAMKARAAELRAQKGGNKKAKNLEALEAVIDELPAGDKEVAVALHQIMTEVAPELAAKIWYGMPAYEDEEGVVAFLQVTSKFETHYSTLGFNQGAQLDEGDMWPTHYAITEINDHVRAKMTELVRKAVGK